jgi:bifunctional UDP-N-acetylglucosamine pyrophosphorylase/glucosamine-1-phosphate N-acetyltransferase
MPSKKPSDFGVIVLAAGRGKRMDSQVPKVLHPVGGRPMLLFPIFAAKALRAKKIVAVVPRDHAAIRAAVDARCGGAVSYAVQEEPRGTGDAVRAALTKGGFDAQGTIVVLNGDMPLVTSSTIAALLSAHRKSRSVMTLLTVDRPDLKTYGRIKRDFSGKLQGIVEAKDATPEESAITEVNVGVYAFEAGFLKTTVNKFATDNAQKEYYLTDALELALFQGLPVAAERLADVSESMGANSRSELAAVNREYYARRRRTLAEEGIELLGEEIFVEASARVSPGVHLQSPCYVKGDSLVEEGAVIETGCVISDSRVRKAAHLKAYSYLDRADVGKGCHVGPFAHLRPDTVLKEGAKIGNFVEIKKTVVGAGSKANHLSYLGDATIGKGVNVGAGTITCNYDGVNKSKTVLADGVFIGSDTQLVAPVKVGKGAFVGAGTTVRKNVKPFSLVINHVAQREIPNWARRKKSSKK